MYVCTCVCMCTYVHVCAWYVCTCVCVCTYVHVCACVCTCVVHVDVCVVDGRCLLCYINNHALCVSIYVCMCVCVHVCVHCYYVRHISKSCDTHNVYYLWRYRIRTPCISELHINNIIYVADTGRKQTLFHCKWANLIRMLYCNHSRFSVSLYE